jgi:hypothetical protein
MTPKRNRKRNTVSDSQGPIHLLRGRLETARLQAIETLAMQDTADPEMLRRIAELHAALEAVRDEISGHVAKVGYGSEEPLA